MKAFLRLRGEIHPCGKQSAISSQQSALNHHLPDRSRLTLKVFYLISRNQPSVMSYQPSALDSWIPANNSLLPKASYLLAFLILVFVSCGAALAQDVAVKATPAAKAEAEITPLKIGDKIPDELWDMPLQVVNHPDGKEIITLNDYKGKLIILDFWATWCTACLKAFPNNNAIQKSYQDEVQILLVNTEINRNQKDISDFLNGYSDKHNTPLLQTSIIKDTLLRTLIPFRLIPHYTWIGKDGTIVASTSSEGVDSANISKLLIGKEVVLANKMDRLDFDPREPFLFDRDIIETGNLKSGYAFSGPLEGLGRISFGSINLNDPVTRIFMINSSVVQMLQEAFQLKGRFNHNRILLNVRDPLLYTYSDKGGLKREEWRKSNSYCYELYTPARTKEKVLEKMKEDILGYFELGAKVENKVMECWILTSNDKKLKGLKQRQTTSDDKGISNTRTVQNIASYLNDRLPIPVVDNSTYIGEVFLDLPQDLSDIKQLTSVLNEAGIYIKKGRSTFPVFIITELNNDLKL